MFEYSEAKNNKYLVRFFWAMSLMCFIWEHDQENDEGRVRINDNDAKKGIVDENQG